MPAPSGAALTVLTDGQVANSKHMLFRMAGTYTAADFDITYADGLGFDPVAARVCNVTDRTETYGTSADADGLKTVAAGTRTNAAHGMTFGSRKLGVDVDVAGPITDNDEVLIEVWG